MDTGKPINLDEEIRKAYEKGKAEGRAIYKQKLSIAMSGIWKIKNIAKQAIYKIEEPEEEGCQHENREGVSYKYTFNHCPDCGERV